MPSLSSLASTRARASMRIKERNGDIVEEEEDLTTVDQMVDPDPIGWRECNNSKSTSNNNNSSPNLAQLPTS